MTNPALPVRYLLLRERYYYAPYLIFILIFLLRLDMLLFSMHNLIYSLL